MPKNLDGGGVFRENQNHCNMTGTRLAQWPGQLGNLAVCATALLVANSSLGQAIIAPPPVPLAEPPPQVQRPPLDQSEVPTTVAPVRANEPLLEWGPLSFRPHFLYRFIYGDGIPAAPGEQRKTAIHEIYPGLLIGIGQRWHLDYTPGLRYYSSQEFEDSLDHTVSLTGTARYEDWEFGLTQGYATSSQPLIETGAQTDQENFNTGLTAARQLNSELSLELGVSQAFRFVGEDAAVGQLSDSRTWSTMNWLNRRFSEQFGAALGLGFAYDDVGIGSDMTSEQLQGRINWRPGDKLTLTLSGGADLRQFLDSGADTVVNPIYALSAQYQLFEPTTLTLSGARTVSASYFADQLTEATTISLAVRQRVLTHFFIDLGGGYGNSSYSSTTAIGDVNRDDDHFFFDARLGVELLRRGTIALFYRHTENSSNETLYDVSSDQFGVEIGYRF